MGFLMLQYYFCIFIIFFIVNLFPFMDFSVKAEPSTSKAFMLISVRSNAIVVILPPFVLIGWD